MTANGLVLYYLTGLAAFAAGRTTPVPWAAVGIAAALAIFGPNARLKVATRAVAITLPLIGWLALIWIWVAPPKPDVLFIYRPSTTESSSDFVAALAIRFFLLALLTLAAVEHADRIRPSFALRLAAPRSAKVLILSASSLSYAFSDAVRRAHTALVAAGVITSRRSLANFRNGWLLIRTSWVAALGIITERLDTKWHFENLPEAAPLEHFASPMFGLRDLLWVTPAIAAVVAEAVL